ncbi:MAG: prepilin-type N-terminal cleavage/methylation domain-containing protein [Myxococcota bacterium]|nr:prepilin-type N-terminal cleavage/methylation domain-containing protein [Myxococcota bacterium]
MSRLLPLDDRSVAARGYTAVEVMMAITVMAVGSAAVISMQKASIQGNLDARKTDVANSIARLWVERIRRDAMQWTQPGPSFPVAPPGNIATAAILNFGVNNAGTWFLPNQYLAATPPMSPGFDILGRDLPLADMTPSTTPFVAGALFCTNIRMTWLSVNELIRVDVRVLWPRGVGNVVPAGGVCANAVATSNAPNPLVFHSIYVTTAVRGNPQ